MQFSATIYACCALAFLGLGALAATHWRERVRGSRLQVAFFVQSAWAAIFAADSAGGDFALSSKVAAELARGFAWNIVLLAALVPAISVGAPRHLLRMVVMASCAVVVLCLLAPTMIPPGSLAYVLATSQSWSGLLVSICGMVLVEQFARNAREDVRWKLKYIWIGIGLMFAIDLGVWSLVLLGGRVDSDLWAARAVVNLLVAGLFHVALSRISGWDERLFKSQGALFFNTTLLLAGAYVLLMAIASYLMKDAWPQSGSIVEVVFLGASIVLLAVALFSDQFRAWMRVTLAKRLLPYRYDYRDVWLRLTRALAETNDIPVHDRVSSEMAALVYSGSACIWVVEPDGSYRRAGGALDMPGDHAVRHDAFLEDLRSREWIYDLDDPRAADSSGTGGAGYVLPPPPWLLRVERAWLIVPLVCNEQMVGFVVISRPLAPTRLGWEQLDILRAASRQIASHLAFHQAATRLAEMHQFAALNRLSGFVMHDLRHLVAQLALVVENASRHRSNPEFIDDAILTIDSSVARMTALMEVLRSGAAMEPERRIDLAELVREVRQRCRHRTPSVEFVTEGPLPEVMADRERLMQALEHLLRNAQEATPSGGRVTLRVRRGSHSAVIEIADTGSGMDPEFIRTRLFKPFDTTKGQQGMGLGAYEAREIVRKLGGTLSVESRVNEGSRFLVELPLAPAISP